MIGRRGRRGRHEGVTCLIGHFKRLLRVNEREWITRQSRNNDLYIHTVYDSDKIKFYKYTDDDDVIFLCNACVTWGMIPGDGDEK